MVCVTDIQNHPEATLKDQHYKTVCMLYVNKKDNKSYA